MSIVEDLEHLGQRIGADVERFVDEGKAKLAEHVKEHPEPLFALLRMVKPVLEIHDIAIVTRYVDVVEVLTNDEAFGVPQYKEKMEALVGDFILGLDDGPRYERDVSILRLAAPRSDVPGLAAFVSQTADALVEEAGGRIEVPELAKRVPARLLGHWFGIPGPDEDSMIAWTLATFEDIFVNLTNDATIHDAAVAAVAAMRPYIDGVIAARKAAGGPPRDDVVGRLIAMQSNPATAFTDAEISANLIGLATGFIPTIATATSLAIDALLKRPDDLKTAHEAAVADDDETLKAVVWEAMRLAPQGPGLLRRARVDFVVAEGTMHATKIEQGKVTFAATESAMLDGDILDSPDDIRVGRPEHDYLHFGAGLHECFGRFANAMAIPLIAKALLARENVARAEGEAGRLVKVGPYPSTLAVTFEV